MKRQTKLSQQHEQQATSEQQTTSESAHEFANAEEVLRFDAVQTSVPPSVARKLQKSLDQTVSPKASWWRKLFGG
jgi:hypothetical protein